jgi:hypothetical protein
LNLRLEKAWLRAVDEPESGSPKPAADRRTVVDRLAQRPHDSTWLLPMTQAQQAALEALAHGRSVPTDLTRGEASLLIEEWGGPASLNVDRIGVRERPPLELGSNCTKAVAVTAAGRVLVSVSKRSAGSPGAGCARYHDRPGAEILHDDDIAAWRGDRYSVVVAPESVSVDLAELSDRILSDLAWRFGDDFKAASWLHRDSEIKAQGRDHLHIAVSAAEGRVVVTQRTMENAVREATKALERARSKGAER